MNKKAFIDFEDINPFSVLLGVLGGFFAFWITGNPFGSLSGGADVNEKLAQVSLFWRITSGIATAFVSFLIVQFMAE